MRSLKDCLAGMQVGTRGVSLMQPAAPEGPGRPAPAPESLAAVGEADVEPSEVFFHRHFALAAQKAAKQGRAGAKARADGESSDSEADIGALPACPPACSQHALAHRCGTWASR